MHARLGTTDRIRPVSTHHVSLSAHVHASSLHMRPPFCEIKPNLLTSLAPSTSLAPLTLQDDASLLSAVSSQPVPGERVQDCLRRALVAGWADQVRTAQV